MWCSGPAGCFSAISRGRRILDTETLSQGSKEFLCDELYYDLL